jgi:hypothetical protein
MFLGSADKKYRQYFHCKTGEISMGNLKFSGLNTHQADAITLAWIGRLQIFSMLIGL